MLSSQHAIAHAGFWRCSTCNNLIRSLHFTFKPFACCSNNYFFRLFNQASCRLARVDWSAHEYVKKQTAYDLTIILRVRVGCEMVSCGLVFILWWIKCLPLFPQGLRLRAVPAYCGIADVYDFLVSSLVAGLPVNRRRIRCIHLGLCTALQTCTALQHPANCWDWVMNMWKWSVSSFPKEYLPVFSKCCQAFTAGSRCLLSYINSQLPETTW